MPLINRFENIVRDILVRNPYAIKLMPMLLDYVLKP